MKRVCLLPMVLALVIPGFCATSESAGRGPEASAAPVADDPVVTRTLSDLLSSAPVSVSALPGFYEEIPPNLDGAVRFIGEENYSSATQALLAELPKTEGQREKARVTMWLGICRATEALDYPYGAWAIGTSASTYLRKAIEMDPKVFEASDVARLLAEMIANGWSNKGEAPDVGMTEAERIAQNSKRGVDAFFAGVMFKREAARVWFYGDTTPYDKKAFKWYSEAVAREPEKYEFWASYLPSCMPLGLHSHMSSETEKMWRHFAKLRNPMLGDQGPASLYLRTRQGYTMADDDKLLTDLEKQRPEEPFATFQYALWAIETTPTMAVERFEDFLKKVDKGDIKLQPREAGYRPSALYKLAFLYQDMKSPLVAYETYRKIREQYPNYAETNGNIAVLCGLLAEGETTGPKKLAYLEEGVAAAKTQEKFDYRGKASRKAMEVRRKLMQNVRKVREELGVGSSSVSTTRTAVAK